MPDEHCYQGPERRSLCTDVLILRQRFDDEEKSREEWRGTINLRLDKQDKQLEKILSFMDKFAHPLNFGIRAGWIILGAVLITMVGLLFRFAEKIIKWALGTN
jgi:hypothetical protein